MLKRLIVLMAMALCVACAQTPTGFEFSEKVKAPVVASAKNMSAEKADRWSANDAPGLFSDDLVYKLDELPMDGTANQAPWAGSYWPVYQDTINYKWDGASSMSPSAKYGEAFDIERLEDQVSQHHGIDHFTWLTECENDDVCDDDLGEVCSKRDGAELGRCIPTWWGICHAWAPVAIMEPEPVRPVTINGVEFKVNDLKALMTLMYNRTESKFVSLRCNANDSLDEVDYDLYDRPTGSSASCKDTNPGTYHVILANYLGLRGESFVEDRTFDAEVWNQPMSGYRIAEMTEVTPQHANVLVGMDPDDSGMFTESFDASLNQGTWKHHVITLSPGDEVKAIMSGDSGDGDLYLRFGTQAPTQHLFDCRSWEHGSNEACTMTAPTGATQVYVSAYSYEGFSDVDVQIEVVSDPYSGVPEAYSFNEDAAYLYYVKSEVDFIVESASSLDGNLAATIGAYTHTDHYEYVLEVDADGLVIGGEWIGASKKNHPDFLWLPTGRKNQSIAGLLISYRAMKEMFELSVSEAEEDNEAQLQVFHETVPQGQWKHFGPFEAGEGAIVVKMSGTEDADLYVRKDAQPTESAYLCRPYETGSVEECALSGSGSYYVSAYGFKQSEIDLIVRYSDITSVPEPEVVEPEIVEEPTAELEDVWPVLEEGSVARQEWNHFGPFTIEAGTLSVNLSGSGDADLYVRKGAEPTTGEYDCRPYAASSNENCTVVGPAEVYVSVRGYQDSEYVLELNFEAQATEVEEPVAISETELVALHLEGTVAKGTWSHYGPYEVANGDFEVVMTGSGDADLYVRRGVQPTTSEYDCRPYRPNSEEDCTLPGPGTFYVSVFGYSDADFELSIEFAGAAAEPSEAPVTPVTTAPSIDHLDVENSVAQGEMKLFTLTLPAHQEITVTTTAPEDIDLYLKSGGAPTTATYDLRAFTYSGNETLTFSSPVEVTLHIGVHGYKASSFTLQTSSN